MIDGSQALDGNPLLDRDQSLYRNQCLDRNQYTLLPQSCVFPGGAAARPDPPAKRPWAWPKKYWKSIGTKIPTTCLNFQTYRKLLYASGWDFLWLMFGDLMAGPKAFLWGGLGGAASPLGKNATISLPGGVLIFIYRTECRLHLKDGRFVDWARFKRQSTKTKSSRKGSLWRES